MTNWRQSNSLFSDFSEELTQDWINEGFDKDSCQKWLEMGMRPGDSSFCNWLQESKKKDPECFLNYEDKKKLLEEYREYLKDLLKELKKTHSINAQKWLDEEYPPEKRKSITELEISNKALAGELVVKDFDSLKYFECSYNSITSLTIENCPNLDHLIASHCDITKVVINDCPKIEIFNVSNNLLTDFNFNSLNPGSLTILKISHNNFSPQTLEFLTPFTKLKRVYLGANDKKRLDENIYNRFTGSLKPLEKLKNLRYLSIDSTDIDDGLKYLAKSFKKISCESKKEDSGCLKIKKELEEALQTEGVTEKLQEVLEGEPEWVKDWYIIAPWRQSQALEWTTLEYQKRKEEYEKYRVMFEEWIKKLGITDKRELLTEESSISERNWTNIHSHFADQELVERWKSQHFTYQEVKDWANSFGSHFNPRDYNFIAWLRDIKQLTAEEVLNHHDGNELRREYQEQKLDAYIQIP